MERAAAHGRLDVVKWLLENTFGNSHDCKRAIHFAAANGHLEVAKYLRTEGFTACDFMAMEKAAKAGYLEVIQWLWTEFGDDDQADLPHLSGKQNTPFESAITAAAGAGHLVVVQYLHELALSVTGKKRKLDQEGRHPGKVVTDRAVAEAARNGHFDVVQWLCTHTTVESTDGAMSNAAYSEHIDIVLWLHENRSERYSTMVMDAASLRGNLTMLKWLRANRPNEGYSTLGISLLSKL